VSNCLFPDKNILEGKYVSKKKGGEGWSGGKKENG